MTRVKRARESAPRERAAMRPPHTGRPRRDVVRALGAAAGGLIGHQPYLLAADVNLQSPAPAIVPLFLCGGAYCLGYTIDGQPFRAVADTGSPFVLVDGTCTEAGARTPWGCFRGTGRSSGLEDTEELFGGEDVGVEWRRGRLALSQAKVDERLRLTAAIDDACFGIVRTYVGKGGGGAVFLGLAKRRQPRIRPTLLEQTDVEALRFDFPSRRLELSKSALIAPRDDAVRTLDLRPRGAPIATYAARIQRLVINGQVVPLDRPTIAVIDTGTTGASVSDALFDAEYFPQQWRDAVIELATESGGVATLEATIRRKRRTFAANDAVPTDPPPDDADEFPLIVSPVRVPWFDPTFGEPGLAEAISRARESRRDGLGRSPHVIFVGLAFLWRRPLTIDIDAGRMTFG